MLVAVTLVNIGRAKIKRASEAARKHKLAAIFFGIAIVVILLSIPWPGTPGGRPLLRGIGGQP
jgi:Na+-driven multidrug efflux pump